MNVAKYLTVFSVFSVVAGVACPVNAITITTEDDVASNSNGEVPTSIGSINKANQFAGGDYSSLTSFTLTNIQVDESSADEGVVSNPRDVSVGFNIDLANQEYTKSGERLQINPSEDSNNDASLTFNLPTPSTKFGVFISDYGNAKGTTSITYQLFDSSNASLGSGSIPIPDDDDISGSETRSVVFWGASTESGNNPINQIVFTTDVTGVDRFGVNEARFQSEPVPFEAEGAMGLVALGGFFGYRYLKKRKQALNQ